MADEEAEVVRMLARKKVRVANHNHALPGIMSEEPSGQSYRGVERFQVPRRHRLNEATDISTRYLRQLFGRGLKMPVRLENEPWPNHGKGKFAECVEVAREERLKDDPV